MDEQRIQIAPNLELVIQTQAQGIADAPGASVTAYYKGVEVSATLIEWWGGKLQMFAWDEYGVIDDPTYTNKMTVAQLELAVKTAQDEE